jgi:hypothetical protein
MMDLHDRLATLAGPSGSATVQQADADVARGRRALRRRRAVQGAGTSAFAVAAVAAAIAYGTTGGAAPAATPPPATAATLLVAYQGEQPKGFTIDKVPRGWTIQGVDESVLTLAPIGAADKDFHSFVDKIAIMLQSKDDPTVPTGTKVSVGGKGGVINTPEGQADGRNLWVKQPDGVWLEAQIWDATGWSQAEIVEFGAGIHVQPGAQRGVG